MIQMPVPRPSFDSWGILEEYMYHLGIFADVRNPPPHISFTKRTKAQFNTGYLADSSISPQPLRTKNYESVSIVRVDEAGSVKVILIT